MASESQGDAPEQPNEVLNGETAESETIAVNGTSTEDQWHDPPTDRAGFLADLQEFHNQRG